MIAKVVHGWRISGLVAYLMGPGRAQEHVDPRVIASWDGRDAGWQPAAGPGGGLDLGPLTVALRAPAIAAELPERPVDGRRGYVWHCSARVSAVDRVLSDAEWADAARELLDGAGIVRRRDPGGARWVAIRHADDHIHIAVVLVRQDTCRRFWPPLRDYMGLRQAAQRIEQRLGLTVTAAADGTAATVPTRGEREKAARLGQEPARLQLARAVRSAAVASDGVEGFVAELERAGLVVAVRRAPSGDAIGYTVGRPGDVTADGRPVVYSGSKLTPDLSLPKLVQRWREAGPLGTSTDAMTVAHRQVQSARAAVRVARRGAAGEEPAWIAHAAADVLTAMRSWSPELAAAADRFDRAARPPAGGARTAGVMSGRLRQVARQLLRQRRATRSWDDPAAGCVALAVAMAALLQEIGAWQRQRGRDHQAAAAREAATAIRSWTRTARPRSDHAGEAALARAAASRRNAERRSAPTTE